jgi:hypothetical protein
MSDKAVPATAAETTPAPTETQKPAIDIDAAINRWWEDHFPGSPVAADTRVWNYAFAAKEDLKQRLAKLLSGGK